MENLESKEIDQKSLEKAFNLYESNNIESIEIGTANGLLQIHKYIFDGVFDFAGEIRK